LVVLWICSGIDPSGSTILLRYWYPLGRTSIADNFHMTAGRRSSSHSCAAANSDGRRQSSALVASSLPTQTRTPRHTPWRRTRAEPTGLLDSGSRTHQIGESECAARAPRRGAAPVASPTKGLVTVRTARKADPVGSRLADMPAPARSPSVGHVSTPRKELFALGSRSTARKQRRPPPVAGRGLRRGSWVRGQQRWESAFAPSTPTGAQGDMTLSRGRAEGTYRPPIRIHHHPQIMPLSQWTRAHRAAPAAAKRCP